MKQITVFYSASSTSSQKTLEWLKENKIHFQGKNVLKHPPTVEELVEILKLTRREGLDYIIALRSTDYKEQEELFQEMKLRDFLKVLNERPKLIKLPLVLAGNKVISGFDKEALEKYVKTA